MMSKLFGSSVGLGFFLWSFVLSAELPNYLKIFPKESHYELKSGAQSIGRSSLRWSESSGRVVFSEFSEMKVTLFGKAQLISTDLVSTVDTNLTVQDFSYRMKSPDSTIEIRGKRSGSIIRLEKIQAGKSQFRDLALQEPMVLASLIRVFAVMKGLSKDASVTSQFDAYLLEPSAFVLIPMNVSAKKIDAPGETWKLTVKYLNHSLESIIRGDGSLVEEVTDIAGMPVVAKPVNKKTYDAIAIVASKTDLVQQARVPFAEVPRSRELSQFRVKVSGIPSHQFQYNRHRQKFVNDVLTVDREKLPIKSSPVQSLIGKGDFKRYLDSEVSIPVFDPIIQRKAQEIVKNESDLWKRAILIHEFVYKHLEKRAFVSLPDALEALQSKQGDCNEHAVLYTALARAAGIPTRTVVGLVFSEVYQAKPEPGFYYHAWVEVFTGSDWVAIDPTWNQIPADATHLAFVEGGADQQIQIASLMGKIKLSPVKDATVN